ncbi:hypothetical protein C170_10290 [Paenibacillus sp. FSL H7-689]|nr:hypothetical protein C170_10290 [Paenibacillus sp. FSL H7-689]
MWKIQQGAITSYKIYSIYSHCGHKSSIRHLPAIQIRWLGWLVNKETLYDRIKNNRKEDHMIL